MGGNLDISIDIHWHAFFATSWVVLFFLQAFLINKKAYRLHQKLGFASILFALGVVISGFYVSLGLVERALAVNSAGAKPLLLVNLVDLFMFAVLYVLAIKKRKIAIEHKRLISLSAIILLNAALFRIGRFFIGPGFPAVLLSVFLTSGMIILFVYSEKRHSQKPNRHIWKLALSMVLILIIRIPLAITPVWADVTDIIMDTF
ncbi:MAG: hypothetical protein AAF696_32140 [Bacteroidota bacterium]